MRLTGWNRPLINRHKDKTGVEKHKMSKRVNKHKKMNDVVFSAMFLALALVMPFLAGQMPQIGSMLCPMHIPVLLCGFFCGGPWGLLVGAIAPILRSFVFGMPYLFPNATCMAFELATYGLVAGFLYRKLPRRKWNVYVSLIVAMVFGRVVWGIATFGCMGFDIQKFGWTAFISGAVINAVPGIVIQLLLIPALVITLDKSGRGKE